MKHNVPAYVIRLVCFSLLMFAIPFSVIGLNPIGTQQRKKPDLNLPAVLYADDVSYDHQLGIITAKGNVEVSHEGRVLEADQLTYHQITDLVVACGNIRLKETTGDISFAEYVELTGTLKEGVIQCARLLLADDTRFTARNVKRTDGGNCVRMKQASYTPCLRCQDHPETPPLWAIHAENILQDAKEGELTYEDATFTFLGVPIAFLPYIKTSLKRRSGFLTPKAGSSGELGAFVGVPYYWVLDSNSGDQDLTFTPYVSTKRDVVLSLEYRQRFQKGLLRLTGSVNVSPKSKWYTVASTPNPQREKVPTVRGHFSAEGTFHLNDNWRFLFQENQLSDKSYSRSRFFLNTNSDMALYTVHPVLESTYRVERFSSNSFFSIQGLHYAGLKAEDRQRRSPLLLPVITYDSGMIPVSQLGYLNLEGNIMHLHRREGDRSRRVVFKGDWVIPYTNRLGWAFSFFSSLRGDLYHTELYQNQTVVSQGTTGRFFPQAGVEWRWPFAHNCLPLVIEPIVQVVASPQGTPSAKIPNEDCRGYQFDETNLFLANRLPGYDLLDYGSRVNYGGQVLYQHPNRGTFLVFLGQSYAMGRPHPEFRGTGIDHHLSDYVGRLSWSGCGGLFHINQRFRIGQEKVRLNLSETEIIVGRPSFNVSASYLLMRASALAPKLTPKEQVSFSVASQFHRFWDASLLLTFDREISKTNWKSLSHGIGVRYKDECLMAKMEIFRTYYRYRDVKPGVTFLFSVVFKNFGGVSYQPTHMFNMDRKKSNFL